MSIEKKMKIMNQRFFFKRSKKEELGVRIVIPVCVQHAANQNSIPSAPYGCKHTGCQNQEV